MRTNCHRRRRCLRFRPALALAGDGAVVLDRRLLLSVDGASGAHARHHATRVAPTARPPLHVNKTPDPSGRMTPAQEINKAYAQFLADFRAVEVSYVQTLGQQSSGTLPVSTTLTAPYLAGSASMQVQDPAVFGTPSPSAPVSATALVGGVPVGTFSLIGSSGNQLAINPARSSLVSLAQGTVLSAQVPVSASSSAATIFPSYIIASTQQMAVQVVSYFNNLPFKLPRKFAFPHQSRQTGALQQYVAQLVVGASPTSLEQSLLAVTLPKTPGGDLQIYDTTINTTVNSSRLQMLNGVHQIFAGKLQVVPTNLSGRSGSTTTGGTGSTSSAGTTGTGSTGTA
jgi:hypothetical protein